MKTRKLVSALKDEHQFMLADLVAKIQLSATKIEIALNPEEIGRLLGVKVDHLNAEVACFKVPWRIKRRGVEKKIIIGDYTAAPDLTLIKLLDQAHGWVQQLKSGVPLHVIADQNGVTPAYIRTRSKIAFLAPSVQEAILGGTLNPEFTANRFVRMKIPADWRIQEDLFFNS